MRRTPYIFVHADDYGMTPASCKRIEQCLKHGCLNSISIMPNGCLQKSSEREIMGEIPCAIHLNLVEGQSLVSPEEVDLLVSPEGYMQHSFFGLLMLSISPKRKRLKEQVYQELKAQIHTVMEYLPENSPVFIDSHQHTHMIPMIFQTMMRIIQEEQIQVQYMRVPVEPILPFLQEFSLYHTYRPINLVKNMVLRFLWLFNKKQFQNSGIKTALFCGIIFSGNMDEKRVLKIFPKFYNIARRKGCNLEFLFHPGYIEKGEEFLDPYKKDFHSFYLSNGRKEEYMTLHSRKWCALMKKVNRKADYEGKKSRK